MPRKIFDTKVEILNSVKKTNYIKGKKLEVLEIATTNKGKLAEFQRLLPEVEIIPKKLNIDEAQTLDLNELIEKKAKSAWEANDYNPILVEDTSLEMLGLNNRPGALIKFFCEEADMRKEICEKWLEDKDRRAIARVMIAIFDGIEVHSWEGKVEGEISKTPKGTNGFGWDDMFIPIDPKNKSRKTFAEMSDKDKDLYSMRKEAIENFIKAKLNLYHPVYKIPEPYDQELSRIDKPQLRDKSAIQFAYSLECLEGNAPNKNFEANTYMQIDRERDTFYNRYIQNTESSSLGLLLTDVDRAHLKTFNNGKPILWQMGPERRTLALAKRAEYFLNNQDAKIHDLLDNLESGKTKIASRSNTRIPSIEIALGLNSNPESMHAIALKEVGYKKSSSDTEVSRAFSSKYGLFNMIGKYPRSIFGVGCLPPVSGWRDVVVTSAIGHMPIFIHRNSLNAAYPKRQIQQYIEAVEVIKSLKIPLRHRKRAIRNIGIALGTNPKTDLAHAKKAYKAGVKLFRIYTINSDPRVIETARVLRKHFGDDIEIFVGQITDKKQAARLIEDDIRADALIFGHGGGRQCTSATNGMAFTALEEIYSVITDPRFNDTTLIQEGGVGKSLGAMYILGLDCILYNQQFAHCVIEQGDLMFQHSNGKICQPYHGSASAATMIIEASNPKVAPNRLSSSGRAMKVEGKPGYRFYEEKANTMAFFTDEFRHYAARTLADLGVHNISELRELLKDDLNNYIRIVSTEATNTGSAYR